MTRDEMLADLVDWYRDQIDGDDPVENVGSDHSEDPPGVQVMYETGKIFWVTVEDIT